MSDFNVYKIPRAVESFCAARISDMAAVGSDIRVILLDDTWSPVTYPAHYTYADLKPFEIAGGTGYTAGGVALTSKQLIYATGVCSFKSDNPEWLTSSFTARWAVMIDFTPGTDATRMAICYMDPGQNRTVNGGTFRLEASASGWWQMQ
jgi:hypothetical protein